MLYKVIPVKSKGIEQPRDFPTQFACKYAQIQKKSGNIDASIRSKYAFGFHL